MNKQTSLALAVALGIASGPAQAAQSDTLLTPAQVVEQACAAGGSAEDFRANLESLADTHLERGITYSTSSSAGFKARLGSGDDRLQVRYNGEGCEVKEAQTLEQFYETACEVPGDADEAMRYLLEIRSMSPDLQNVQMGARGSPRSLYISSMPADGQGGYFFIREEQGVCKAFDGTLSKEGFESFMKTYDARSSEELVDVGRAVLAVQRDIMGSVSHHTLGDGGIDVSLKVKNTGELHKFNFQPTYRK